MYRIEQEPHRSNPTIVINGFEQGVADDPFEGISKLRGMNLISTPKEAITLPRVTNVAPYSCVATFTADAAADTITLGTPSVGIQSRFMSGQFTTTGSLPGGLSLSTTYWVAVSTFILQSSIAAGTTNTSVNSIFKVFTTAFCPTAGLVNITDAGSGTHTFTATTMGKIINFERNYGFALDANGRVWAPINPFVSNRGYTPYYNQLAAYPGMYTYLGNDITGVSTGTASGSLAVYRGSGSNFYLYLFKAQKMDYTRIPDILSNDYTSYDVGNSTWVTDWDPATGSGGSGAIFSVSGGHKCLVGTDNVIYITDGTYVVSLYEKSGQTFVPATTTTYTYNATALALPRTETAQCIEELGTNLYIGGAFRYIYPWDRISTSFTYPIVCVEQNIQKMVAANSNLYVFAGFRGRIYVSNGSQLQLFKKVPDHYVTGNVSIGQLTLQDPTITFTDCTVYKNQLYFCCNSYSVTTQDEFYVGLFAIDLETNAFRATFPPSNTTSVGVLSTISTQPSTMALYAYPNTTSQGSGLAIAWQNQFNGFVGIDWSNDTRYWTNSTTTSTARVETDIIPIGTFLNKRTLENIEFKLAQPMVGNEQCSVGMRSNISNTYTTIGTTTYNNLNGETAGTTTNILSDVYTLNSLENLQWGQFIFQGFPNTNIYYAGTVTVTNGSKVVTGSGTVWDSTMLNGYFNIDTVNGGPSYSIASIDSTTQLTLVANYQETTGGSKSYTIQTPQSGIRLTELRIR